jgi:excisionase family DNA binding protein
MVLDKQRRSSPEIGLAPEDHIVDEDEDSSSTNTPENRGWITIRQMATILEKDYRTVRKWVADEKRILAVKVGGQYRIYREEVDYVLQNGTREPIKEEPSHGT